MIINVKWSKITKYFSLLLKFNMLYHSSIILVEVYIRDVDSFFDRRGYIANRREYWAEGLADRAEGTILLGGSEI